MKKTLLLLIFLVQIPFILQAQKEVSIFPKTYWSSGGEWIFSGGTVQDYNNVLRWAPVFNFQNFLNFDQSPNFGWFTGANLRNVGFIFDESPSVRKKVRTYNVGVPLGIKFGNLNSQFFFAGYELEWAVNYRERTFVDERRVERFNVWFSDRVNRWQSSFFAGMNLPGGGNIKIKYYPTEFFNRSFTATDGDTGALIRPYENFRANVFYVSLSFDLFREGKIAVGDN
ncbi:hypothetical protein [Cecembia lonarensis]|uniref:Outer membrane protein beta-barrel domain-containing protein n=1 Tax=Cecembia lonarensis (strain CCUG 58316 / KCTC 22772 / LW9) TaxID=1225176 RepID=K1L5T5_CECL9|nr:hypothetical protein [Cecembia lonarensis]EKB47437.1 hypothetical protein B879_03957 [Cecembia lonarensis LW9]